MKEQMRTVKHAVWMLVVSGIYGPVMAQPNQSSAPMVIVDEALTATEDSAAVRVTLANRSPKGISAHTIVADYLGDDGKLTGRAVYVGVAGRSRPTSESHPPGHQMEIGFNIPVRGGKPVDYRVFVDYVRFDDGESWGSDVTHNSLQIDGMIKGWRMAEAHLRGLLRSGGASAVAKALAQ